MVTPEPAGAAVGDKHDDGDEDGAFTKGGAETGAVEPAVLADLTEPGDATTPGPHTEDQVLLQVLVCRVMRQDEAALAELYRHLAMRVFRQASRLVRDIGTAEEVVEDVFWQVWRQAPRFDASRGSVTAWVMQMARSRALDALRARGRHPLLTALDLEDDAHMPVADGADPQGLLDRQQTARRVQEALGLLDPLRRQLLALAYEQGYSQSEVAEQMGLPLGTVKSHIRRALATMKTILEPALGASRGDLA